MANPVAIYSEPVCSDTENLTSYLNDLCKKIIDANCEQTVNLRLANSADIGTVAAVLAFEPKTQKWSMIEPSTNDSLPANLETEQMVEKALSMSFVRSPFQATVITNDNDPSQERLTQDLYELKKEHLEQISKIEINDANDSMLFALAKSAAVYGHSDFIDTIMAKSVNLRQDYDKLLSLAKDAVNCGHVNVYETLREHHIKHWPTNDIKKFDLDMAKYAIESAQDKVLNNILSRYATLEPANIAPLVQCAVLGGHPNAIVLLKSNCTNLPEEAAKKFLTAARDVIFLSESEWRKTHEPIIALAGSLRYFKRGYTPGGLCNGFTNSWISACLLDDKSEGENRFEQRVTKITHENPEDINRQISEVREKVISEAKAKAVAKVKGEAIKETSLEEGDWDLLEIHAFYDSVFVQQDPSKYTHQLFNESLTQNDIEKSSEYFVPVSVKKQGNAQDNDQDGLKNIHSQVDSYTQDEITTYLQSIADTINKVGYEGKVCFHLDSRDHAIGIKYDGKLKEWTFMDINNWPPRRRETAADIAHIIFTKGFVHNVERADSTVTFGTNLLTREINPKLTAIATELDALKAERVQKITMAMPETRMAYLAESAAWRGDLAIVEQIIKLRPTLFSGNSGVFPAENAAQNGHVNVIEALINANVKFDNEKVAETAAKCGHANVIELLLNRGVDFDKKKVVETAASEGHVNVIEALINANVKFDNEKVAETAAKCGHANVIESLIKHVVPFNINRVAKLAALNGNANIIKALIEHEFVLDTNEVADSAGKTGWVDVIELLIKHHFDFNKDKVAEGAAKAGYANVIEALVNANVDFDKDKVAECAAQNGNGKVLIALSKQGYKLAGSLTNEFNLFYKMIRDRPNNKDFISALTKIGIIELIQSTTDFERIFILLNQDARAENFEQIKLKLTDYIHSLEDVKQVFSCLEPDQCEFVLNKLQENGKLLELIPSNNVLKTFLEHLPDDKSKRVCAAIIGKQSIAEKTTKNVEEADLVITGSGKSGLSYTKTSEQKQRDIKVPIMKYEIALVQGNDAALRDNFNKLVNVLNEHRSKYFKFGKTVSCKQFIEKVSNYDSANIARLNDALGLQLSSKPSRGEIQKKLNKYIDDVKKERPSISNGPRS